ncbi:MAG TPA: histidine phosphatase family protein [Candidatus Sumerlaeota bacterium]|nr:histidine phosphatase family protein [Candidatus Sumerlaeota bacterium]HOR28718.1 histidine phosphatase family protein [Candidatus Sumerlaeota bacterium]HPK02485.1 histidine phosphatase family protein [Candidatus Sumerlaeota bacterium]
MKLFLLRHGEAVDAAEVGGDDRARTLTKRGRRQGKIAGKALRRLDWRPAVVVTSPYPRAAETARRAAKALKGDVELVVDAALEPGASPEAMLECVGRHGDEGDLLLVGHNPDLERLIACLVGGGAAGIELEKGAVAALDLGEEPPAPGRATLLALAPPALLEALVD